MQSCTIPWLGCLLIFVTSVAAPGQENPNDEIRKRANEIRNLLNDGELQAAIDTLEKSLKKWGANSIEVSQLQEIRTRIGLHLMRNRKNDLAISQYQKAIDYLHQHIDKSSARRRLMSPVQMLNSLYRRSDRTAEANEMLLNTIAGLQQQEAKDEVTEVSQQVAFFLKVLARARDLDQESMGKTRSIIAAELKRLEAWNQQKPTHEPGIVALSRMLATAAVAHQDDTAKAATFNNQRFSLITEALAKNDHSVPIAYEYATTMIGQLGATYRDDPEKADQIYRTAVEKLERANEKLDSRLDNVLVSLRRYEAHIAASRKVKAMIGKPAPNLDAEFWINNDRAKASVESLKGKVLMIDFWAVWCGPCIRTFPHLKEWRKEFEEQGFEIVGVTKYYRYQWNDDLGRPQRADRSQKVTAEEEREMIAKFMKSHQLNHPSVLMSKKTEMQSEFGVTSIPHVVLIDRKGKVRMVKIGSDDANVKSLHDMIKKLVSEK